MSNCVVIQLARLGDLLQTLPALRSLQCRFAEDRFDLLCAAPLTSLGSLFPMVRQILPWDGTKWGSIAQEWKADPSRALGHALHQLACQGTVYDMAYNLNNHTRAVLAAHLFAAQVHGVGAGGPLSSSQSPWSQYLQIVATRRGQNRIHLADAFCGLCGVRPPTEAATLSSGKGGDFPPSVESFLANDGIRVALVIGSGDADRRIPLHIWEQWINTFFAACPEGRVMLVGGEGERELTHTLLDRMPSLSVGRIWDVCGQTTLPQLAGLLSQCDWVVGSDTGPLHLGVACGTKVQGFYFSRARVHETGPYGHGHWVWQAEQSVKSEKQGVSGKKEDISRNVESKVQNVKEGVRPTYWPVKESVELLLTEKCSVIPDEWSLWTSHRDHWGAYYSEFGQAPVPPYERELVWEQLEGTKDIDWVRLMVRDSDSCSMSV